MLDDAGQRLDRERYSKRLWVEREKKRRYRLRQSESANDESIATNNAARLSVGIDRVCAVALMSLRSAPTKYGCGLWLSYAARVHYPHPTAGRALAHWHWHCQLEKASASAVAGPISALPSIL